MSDWDPKVLRRYSCAEHAAYNEGCVACEVFMDTMRAANLIESQATEIERLKGALVDIRDSKHCQYEENGVGGYGIGVTDGHRFCANIARAALQESK